MVRFIMRWLLDGGLCGARVVPRPVEFAFANYTALKDEDKADLATLHKDGKVPERLSLSTQRSQIPEVWHTHTPPPIPPPPFFREATVFVCLNKQAGLTMSLKCSP
jgi:hypothetical protein